MKLPSAASSSPVPSPARGRGDGAPANVDVDEAIRAVLAAEAAAGESLRAAECEAEALRDGARTDARSIAARAERRIGLLRHGFEALTRQVVAALDVERLDDAGSAPSPLDRGLVERAARAVADELTGGRP